MKKFNFNYVTVLLGVLMMVFITSCKDDNGEETIDYTPVLNKNFSFTVNANDVVFTTTIPGNVWFTVEGTDYPTVDKTVTVNLPLKGTYPVTCSTLGSGVTLTSAAFDVVIEADDLSFLEEGIWKALTGGADGNKVWILDMEKKYFHNPLDFYGDEEAGGTSTNIWGPWGGTDIYGWGSTPEVGEITFNGVTRNATLTLTEGVNADGTSVAKADGTGYEYGKNATSRVGTFEGTFSMTSYERDANFLILSSGATLWENMLTGQYKYLGELSEEMADITFAEGLRFPLDINRVGEQQFLPEDLMNVKIMHCSDSALVVRVKRTYEGFDASGNHTESKCWLLYNYIVKGYDYPEDVFVAPDRPATSGTLEDGTYKLAEIPGFYYNWITLALGDTWTELDAYKKNMAEWWALGNPAETMTDGEINEVGQARWDAAYSAYTAQTIVVSGSNITVNYKGINVWGANPTELIDSTYVTTFTSAGGVITLAAPISVYTPNAAFDNVSELYILPGLFTTGIAIGLDNIDEANKKYETKLQNWIKQ